MEGGGGGGGGGGKSVGEEPPELRDDFEEQFADELEALAEMEGDSPWAVPTHKVSEFRSRKRTFEEALCDGDWVKEPGVGGGRLSPQRGSQDPARLKDFAEDEGPQRLSSLTGALEDHPSSQKPDSGLAHTPKPKRRRGLEAVKKLDFRRENGPALEEGPEWQGGITPPLSPKGRSGSPDPRLSGLKDPDCTGLEDLLPLHRSPPAEREAKKVRKRPPVLEDYINVTSTSGSRVFMVVKEDGASAEVATSVGRNWQRPLHLLGVPFSYLKEQVAEERRRVVLDSSHRLTKVLNSCLSEDDPQTVAPVEGEEGGGGAEGDGSAPHALWVDHFAPRRYVELLSDDYTNRCLLKWLKLWDTVVFGKERPSRNARPSPEVRPPFRSPKEAQSKWKTKAQLTEETLEAELDQHNRPKFKVALLCGPPGLGKTTLALVIARHAGYNAVEMNASDDRSPEVFKTRIEAATQMKSVLGASERPNCLIIDEIDGAPTASINVLLSIINRQAVEAEPGSSAGRPKKKRKEGGLLLRPIICICNDQYVPSLRLLKPQAFLLNFPTTAQSRLVQRLQEITVQQGMKTDMAALMALCEKAENDIRSCINTLQFLHSRGKKEVSVRTVQAASVGLKDQSKGLFAIWQEVFQLPKMHRQRIGVDPEIPAHLTEEGNGPFGVVSGRGAVNAAAQRFHHLLHLCASSGENEKLTQGLYDNFLNMRIKDANFGSVCVASEWLSFSDLLNRVVMNGQHFQLMRYLPFLPVSFHFLFAASNVPRLVYPHSQHEALAKLTKMQNLMASLISGVTPTTRSRTAAQPLVLETLCLLLEVISPKLRPVNTQLYSQKEKQQLAGLIGTMLAYNLTYHQERTPDGQYVYTLDPNVEQLCRFPSLPVRKPLTYQAKQLIAREIELEKMRRSEATLQTRNSAQAPEAGLLPNGKVEGVGTDPAKARKLNHEQRLDHIVKGATFDEKPETDFFGRLIVKKTVSPAAADQAPVKNTIEKQIGKAVGQSDVWFRFNEGVSNAVRRNIYIKDLF